MPTLIVDNLQTRRAGPMPGRVLIGRQLPGVVGGVRIDDPQVSALHAWIDTQEDGTCLITDAGSRTGTLVNGQRLTTPRRLRDTDHVRVGPATITVLQSADLPPATTKYDWTSPESNGVVHGMLFACACGSPLWVAPKFAGTRGRCRYCNQTVHVPTLATADAAALKAIRFVANVPAKPPVKPRPATPPQPLAACGICQSPITADEETTTCPSCAGVYHAECWTENQGCAAYGCAQVHALLPEEEASVATGKAHDDLAFEEETTEPRSFPWQHLLLAGSVLGSLIGLLTFGVPALLVGLAAARYGSKHKGTPRGKLSAIAAAIALTGVAAGIAVSWFWWIAK